MDPLHPISPLFNRSLRSLQLSATMTEPQISPPTFPPPTKVQMHPVFQLQDFLLSLTVRNVGDRNEEWTVEEKRDQAISVAEFLFGSSMVAAALTLLDNQGSCSKMSSPHRSLWLVRGSTDVAYMCFSCDETPHLYYCNCRSFLEKTTKKPIEEEGLPELCKHLLALKLIPALQIEFPHLTVSDKEFAKLVLERTWK
jgi:hypothetical protein